MLELSFLKTNKERAIQGLKIRNFSDEALQVIDRILEADEKRRNAQVELDNNLAESKRFAGEIAHRHVLHKTNMIALFDLRCGGGNPKALARVF